MHRNVATLEGLGLVERDERGAVRVPFDRVEIHLGTGGVIAVRIQADNRSSGRRPARVARVSSMSRLKSSTLPLTSRETRGWVMRS